MTDPGSGSDEQTRMCPAVGRTSNGIGDGIMSRIQGALVLDTYLVAKEIFV